MTDADHEPSAADDDPADMEDGAEDNVDGGSGNDAIDERTQALLDRAEGVEKPIADTHIHLYQPSGPGVVWPEPTNELLYQDYLPERYMELALGLGILGSGIVEASPFNDDTQWVLAQVAAHEATDAFYPWYVAQLDIGSADFVRNLDAYLTVDEATNPHADRVVGLRVYLWSAAIDLDDPVQQENLNAVQERGLTLDIISRGKPPTEKNPKAAVIAIAEAYPDIRIIIDHMSGAKIDSAEPDERWEDDIAALAAQPNIYIKWSSFFDAANATGEESGPWESPKDLESYQGIFDTLWEAFGEDRMIFGSNYPVVELGGTLADEIALAEEFLADKSVAQRDKVMFENAILFYRRLPPGEDPTPSEATQALLDRAQGEARPIMDTHVHIYQPSRSAVVWPESTHEVLFKDHLLETRVEEENPKASCGPTYSETIEGSNVLAVNVVEASPRHNDATGSHITDWILSQTKDSELFFNYTAELDISAKDFIKNLDLNASGMTADGVDRERAVAGLRVYLWSAAIDVEDPVQAANLAEVERRGMTLDIISRGKPPNEKNPKAGIIALARAFPGIRIIIDHMAGAKIDSAEPDERWEGDVAALGAEPNIYLKWSSFFDAANATGDESIPWAAPKSLEEYQGLFDTIWEAFGEDRVIFGSNWPVVNLAGTFEEQVAIAEQFLATKTSEQRDKVMFKNAILFYRRVPPQPSIRSTTVKRGSVDAG